MNQSIGFEDILIFEQTFDASPLNRVAENAVTRVGIGEAAVSHDAPAINQHEFSIDVESGKVTDQKRSGRCWMFAALNVMRVEIMKKLNLDNMELSQNYTLFWDKLEKSNYFLENIIETADLPLKSREVAWLLKDPVGDGGQWDMFRSIIAKYGVVPKDKMPETAVSSDTALLKKYITLKLREFAMKLRQAHEAGEDDEKLRDMKDDMMETIYRILVISLGKPPASFTWEVRDKEKNFYRIGPVTPQKFYQEYVGLNLDDLVTAINAPTADKPFGRTYTVKYLGSVRGGEYPVKYLNLPMEDLKDIAIRQLKDGRLVWFGSDVSQFSEKKDGFLTMDVLEIDKLFSTEFPMTKAERLDYGESLMTHAMVITGVDLVEKDGKEIPVKWKVENSWGEDRGNKGYYVMDDAWFSEFAYQILLDKKYFSDEQREAFETEPIVLDPWDPMGSLA